MVKFAYTILYVQDVEKTIEFYEAAFGFQRKFITPEGDYGELLSGETRIAFANFELGNSNLSKGYQPSQTNAKPFGIELAFTTEDIEETIERAIGAGAVLLEAMRSKPWGQRLAYLQDINGFLLEICTPMEAA